MASKKIDFTMPPYDADFICDTCGVKGAYQIESEELCMNCIGNDVFDCTPKNTPHDTPDVDNSRLVRDIHLSI